MAEDLFSTQTNQQGQPLAYRMSPRTLDEYIGQSHIVGPGRLLRRVIQADQLSSLIFYGPPGTGKTSLARVIARTTRSAFTSLNAVLTGVKDLREAIKDARERRDLYERKTILFVDEVHRWNRAQQDALLPWVENGTVVLIGATTQNPYFEVNSALVSRSRIFQLTPLTEKDLLKVAEQALGDEERGYGRYRVDFAPGALEHLVEVADGDARSLLNALELAVETSPELFPPPRSEKIHISMDAAEQSIQKRAVLYDKEGDYHFDTISAFIKSVRGSDPDAALYWLARMVHAGEDPHFIFRRLLISASEDIGMADPYALGVVESAAAAFDRVGMPEGRYHLTHATLYLANSAKSNSALGFFDALSQIESERSAKIPDHLKDASRDAKGFGHGEGYLYPHAYRDHWVTQQYLPSVLQGKIFYRPSNQGYEQSIRDIVAGRREAQLAAGLEEERPEVLTYSPPNSSHERWVSRIIENRGTAIAHIRKTVFEKLTLGRHYRVCIVGAEEGTFLWEALRRVPEGGVTGIVTRPEKIDFLRHYAEQLDETRRPELYPGSPDAYIRSRPDTVGTYETVLGRNIATRTISIRDNSADEITTDPVGEFVELLKPLFQLLSVKGTLLLAETIPGYSRRLSDLATGKRAGAGEGKRAALDPEQLKALRAAEEALYTGGTHPLLHWDEKDLRTAADLAGFSEIITELETIHEERYLKKEDLERWFSTDSKIPTLGNCLLSHFSRDFIETLVSRLKTQIGNTTVDWTSSVCFLSARRPEPTPE